MKIGKTFYAANRRQWRAWLRAHHAKAPEIWLVYYKKDSGKPRIPYDHAVEEALCFGWIDSTMKGIDGEKFAQRFSPRRPGSVLSELNKERVRRLMRAKKMMPVGLEKISHAFDEHRTGRVGKFVIPAWIERALRKDPIVWRNFCAFPQTYRRIRIGWIAMSSIGESRRMRLRYFLRMTAKNKRFGTIR